MRVLRRNHSGAIPDEMIFLDTETKKVEEGLTERHRMVLAWSCFVIRRPKRANDQEEWEFWDKTFPLSQYLELKARPHKPLWIFGHNVFFDLQSSDFFYYFTRWGWILDFVYDEGMSYILIIHKGDRTIKAVSSTNYYDASLGQLGELLGLPKLGVDFDDVAFEELELHFSNPRIGVKNLVSPIAVESQIINLNRYGPPLSKLAIEGV